MADGLKDRQAALPLTLRFATITLGGCHTSQAICGSGGVYLDTYL
jgi:hypothetical protein